jgi:hypothetical protein
MGGGSGPTESLANCRFYIGMCLFRGPWAVGHGNHGTRKQIPCHGNTTETHGNHGKNRNSPKTPPKGRDQRANSALDLGARGFGQGCALGATPGIGATETHGNTPNRKNGVGGATPGLGTPPLPLPTPPAPSAPPLALACPAKKNAADLSCARTLLSFRVEVQSAGVHLNVTSSARPAGRCCLSYLLLLMTCF